MQVLLFKISNSINQVFIMPIVGTLTGTTTTTPDRSGPESNGPPHSLNSKTIWCSLISNPGHSNLFAHS